MDGILLALLHAREVLKSTVFGGYGRVRFLDSADHFGVNFCLHFGGWRHDLCGELVLGFKVKNGFGMLSVAQPEPVICHDFTVNGGRVGDLLSEWRSDPGLQTVEFSRPCQAGLVPEMCLQLQSFTPIATNKVIDCRCANPYCG